MSRHAVSSTQTRRLRSDAGLPSKVTLAEKRARCRHQAPFDAVPSGVRIFIRISRSDLAYPASMGGGTRREGRSYFEFRWNRTEVFRRDSHGWRLIQTHWSFTNPPK